MPERSAFHPLATEAAVMHGLAGTGVAVPPILGVHPQREAVLEERVPGATWFYRIKDPDEQVRVAHDFVRNLAALHRLDPNQLGIEALGPVRSAREHALERIAAIRWRGTAPDGSMDPLLRLSTDWLERNVPDYDGPVVLVQGDTGPGNFMYAERPGHGGGGLGTVALGRPDGRRRLAVPAHRPGHVHPPAGPPGGIQPAVRPRHRRVPGLVLPALRGVDHDHPLPQQRSGLEATRGGRGGQPSPATSATGSSTGSCTAGSGWSRWPR